MLKTGAIAPALFYAENMTIHLLNSFTCNSRFGI
jgi:hypothetical protein